MADVSFNEEPSYSPSYAPASQKSGITSAVMKLGLAKDEKQAQTALIVVVVLCVLIVGAVFFFTRRNVPPPQTPGSESWPKPVAPSYRR